MTADRTHTALGMEVRVSCAAKVDAPAKILSTLGRVALRGTVHGTGRSVASAHLELAPA